MSDEENTEAIEGEVIEPTEPVEAAAEEHPKGHMSKEAWIEKGNDPDEWRSPEAFKERGKWIKEVDRLKQQVAQHTQDTDVQIRNLNQLHNIQLQQTIGDLEGRRNEAIDDANTEQANQIQDQIDKARQAQAVAQAPVAPVQDPAVADWESKNAWVMNPNDPKTPYANQQFVTYQNQGYTPQQALQLVDGDIERAFPSVNASRQTAAVAEGGSAPGGRRGSTTGPTWDQLTREEQTIYNAMPAAWGSQQDFLKAVANDRKGA